MQSDISIGKFVIFKHNGTRNVLMYEHHLCLFSTPIKTPPKHGFWMLKQHLLATKIVDHAFLSWYAGIKKVIRSGLHGRWSINSTFWPVKKVQVWADIRKLALSWWTMIRLHLFVYRISPKTGKQTTQNWLPYDAQVKQFSRRNRRFFHEQLSLDLARLRRPTWWTVVLFRAHTQRCMIRQLWRSYKRLLKQK